MKELDLLKKNWNTETFQKVSAEDIYKMILKKSSSAVKWIFIISIIELGLGLISAFLYHPESNEAYNLPFWVVGWQSSALVSIIALYFIYRFYKNYKTINTTGSINELLTNIINTRKTVKLYVIVNIFLAAVLFATSFIYIVTTPLSTDNTILFELATTKDYFILGVITLIATALMMAFFLLIYFLLYGILMRRLNRNYKELKQLKL